ncbi:DNA-binding MarR family transcriptional regulator [Maribacter vaceletii]|uniref:DNA-binding MarR family transcriptional regulator n=1 Tax=Maribacter vaceletii TaxID=1206816 RepID=A0A495DSC4_9FLAO|nr:MarR family transcriptional regulator [Maribacter vaceletii]RKR07035.1 DNA-binding MarR family transcriptional regulator [Maribacter vaceletii]
MNVEEIIKTDKKMELPSKTVIHLMLVSNKVNETINATLKPFDVSIQQFNVLRILRGQCGKPANLKTLNERMVTKMSNTTRLVDKLILKGYVKRKTCETNRRKIEIYITTKGEKALSSMDIAMNKNDKHIVQNFSEEELEYLNVLFNKF